MSEEKDTSVDKQEELKEKLKDMGVMQGDSETKTSSAETKSSSAESSFAFLKSQWPVLLAIVVVMTFGWLYVFNEDPQTTAVSDLGSGPTPVTSPYPYQTPGYPPPPYPRMERGEMPAPPTMPGFSPRESIRGTLPTEKSGDTDTATMATPAEPWADPMHRSDDRFGPPPGWERFQPPPRRPRYYGPPSPYDGQPYFGPPPGLVPYGPPPGYYGPPPGYYPGY